MEIKDENGDRSVSATTKSKTDVYNIVNGRILAQLEKGVVPWKKNWHEAEMPANLISQKKYRGINILLLSSLGFARNYFLTFHQVKELGAKIKEGEKPCPVVYWKRFEEEPDENSGEYKVKKPLLRYYNVYNIAQCAGIPENLIPVSVRIDPVKSCEEIMEKMKDKPTVVNYSSNPYYAMELDILNLPDMQQFEDGEAYYETLFHELVHSTGHPKRLARKEMVPYTADTVDSYSTEELIAEIGACYLKAQTGLVSLQHFDNNVAYINGWLKKLKDDRRCIVYASTQAQKAVDFILNTFPGDKKEDGQ